MLRFTTLQGRPGGICITCRYAHGVLVCATPRSLRLRSSHPGSPFSCWRPSVRVGAAWLSLPSRVAYPHRVLSTLAIAPVCYIPTYFQRRKLGNEQEADQSPAISHSRRSWRSINGRFGGLWRHTNSNTAAQAHRRSHQGLAGHTPVEIYNAPT